MGLSEWAGVAVGVVFAPTIALTTLVRRGRTFHPDGVYYAGRAEASADDGAWGRAAARLSGPVLVRVSGGARPITDARRDVVGMTLRFHGDDSDGLEPRDGDQDLLFASFESLAQIGRGLRTTDTRNLLANTYYVAMRYRDADLGETTFRLVPEPQGSPPGDDGLARLDAAVAAGGVVFHMEARGDGQWHPLVDLHLEARIEGDDRKTGFTTDRTGRGAEPIGFVAGLRRVAYVVGQRVR